MTSPRRRERDPPDVEAVDLDRAASTSYSRGTRYVVVVLPEPDGPTSATSSPGCASKSIVLEPERRDDLDGAGGSAGRPDRAARPRRSGSTAASSTGAAATAARTSSASSGRGRARPRRGLAPTARPRSGSGTRRRGTRTLPRPSAGSSATASGASTISGSISRYSKIRSNRASAPWISTWTLSSWPSGKKSRLWSVVNATMSPIVGRVGSP